MNSQQKTILVTGASGYMASWIVAQLLELGHHVHATVRDLSNATKVQHLQDLCIRYPGQLELFEADLTRTGSFDAAMAGCELVIHTASPYFLDKPKDIQRQLIAPALEGTLNVLAAVDRCASVTRVVLTSSVAALYDNACDLTAVPKHQVQESDVNPNRNPQHNPYAYSKTIAEQAAWAHQAKQSRWDMVSIHPGAIFGPALSHRVDATSISMMRQFLNGSFKAGVPRLFLGIVDVRDAALAHVRAALMPNARGRYIAVAQTLRLLEMAALMRVEDAGLSQRLPRKEMPKALIWLAGPWVGMQRRYVARNVGYPMQFDNRRSISELVLQYRSVEETLNDHIRQLVADGLIMP
jgi:nucleoside-diphosphate-sugar epimerase